MRIVNDILENTDFLIHSFRDWMNGDPRKNLDPYTAHNGALVTRDGSMYSVIQLRGYGTLLDMDGFVALVELWEELLRTRLSTEAVHELDVCFEGDEPGDILDENFAPAIAQAKRMGMDIEDIFDEKKERYRQLCLEERCYLIIYTVPHRLKGPEGREADAEVKESRKNHIRTKNSQRLGGVASTLFDRHRETVVSITNFLNDNGYLHNSLSHVEALKVLRSQLFGHQLSQRWQPSLPESDYPLGEVSVIDSKDGSFLLPRALFQQIMDQEPEVIGRKFIALGDKIFAPVRFTQLPERNIGFDKLVKLLRSARIPYRFNFKLKPNGLYTNRWDVNVAEWTSFAGNANAQINSVYKGLSLYEKQTNTPIVAISAMACTWAPLDALWRRKAGKKGLMEFDLAEVRRRVQALINRINDWGSAQADNTLAYPMKALYATSVGGHRNHYSPVAPAPLDEALSRLPFTRIGLPWKQGTMLYRTNDGALVPYEQYSAMQSYWITLVSGPMGYGKSSAIASKNFAFLVQPSDSPNLPILRGIDIGTSQKPVVDLIRDSLPENQKHKAFFLKFRNRKQHGTNPFDTDLGCRHATSTHRSFLINLVCTFASNLSGWHGLPGLVTTVVDMAFKKYDDAEFNHNAKRYSAGINPVVDDLLNKHGIQAISRETNWWTLVDELFARGEVRGAKIAQRYAMPTVPDLDGLAKSSEVLNEYPDTMNGTPYVDLFSRSIREAVRQFPFLSSATQLDISDSPIVVIDLEGVIQRSEDPLVLQQNAIYFMIVFRMLTGDFFIDEDVVDEMPERYRQFHYDRVQYLKACKKRFFADEVHRFSAVPGSHAQLDQMGVEARKFFVDLLLGSQIVLDFPAKLRDLASTTIMCGGGGPEDLNRLCDAYGLNSAAAEALARIRLPTKDGAEMLMMVDNKQVRRQVIPVINTEGPRFLWATATNAPDRKVRDRLSEVLGDTALARKLLAEHYPSGNIRAEQERRQRMLGRDVGSEADDILMTIVEELAGKVAT